MIKFITITIISLSIIGHTYAQDLATGTISLGPVKVGENRLELPPEKFEILFKEPAPYLDVKLMKESLQWIRTKSNVLLPRMKLFFILLNRDIASYSLNYSGKSFLFQFSENGAIAQVNYSLFDPKPVEIYKNGKLINVMAVRPKAVKEKTGLIDYSCSNFDVQINLPIHRYFAVGCVQNITGKLGNEKRNVEVSWVIPEMTLLNDSPGPFVTNFIGSGAVETQVKDLYGNVETVKVSTKFDNQYKRLGLAVGFGPTYFKSSQTTSANEAKLTTPLYLYGNYSLTQDTSIRLFDAYIQASNSYFNNAGLYLAYDVAKVFDSRIIVTPLFGFQVVTHSHNDGPSKSQELFPQGFEIVYKHAFGKKNYSLGFGTFISTSSSDEYSNTWIRYGKRWFWELNYISWDEDERRASLYGLSVGIPVGRFF